MMLDFSYTFHMLAQLNSEHAIDHEFYQLLWVKEWWGILYQDCSSNMWVLPMCKDSHILKFIPVVPPNEKQGLYIC